jgi:hypothetical protein
MIGVASMRISDLDYLETSDLSNVEGAAFTFGNSSARSSFGFASASFGAFAFRNGAGSQAGASAFSFGGSASAFASSTSVA